MRYECKQNSSRLAWCYGDLTALYVLLHMLPVFPAKNDVVQMLELVAKRRIYSETYVRDAGFCHGASGIAHIFNRLYRNTGNVCFEETAKYWLERTLLLGCEAEGVAGYIINEHPNIHPLDLLVSVSGIGSVLLSFQNPELINWDETMLLI